MNGMATQLENDKTSSPVENMRALADKAYPSVHQKNEPFLKKEIGGYVASWLRSDLISAAETAQRSAATLHHIMKNCPFMQEFQAAGIGPILDKLKSSVMGRPADPTNQTGLMSELLMQNSPLFQPARLASPGSGPSPSMFHPHMGGERQI